MNVTVIGAGNSGLATAAHLSAHGHAVTLWNRTAANIEALSQSLTVFAHGVLEGAFPLKRVTADLKEALADAEAVLITTPASAHKGLAEAIAQVLPKAIPIVLNPGRTFGALEFKEILGRLRPELKPLIAETQSIIYTCRKTNDDTVMIYALKDGVRISTLDARRNPDLLKRLPKGYADYLSPASSMIETSIGNVGMVLHCAPLLLNAGWTENQQTRYKYYHEGITPTIAAYLEEIDAERMAVALALGHPIESTKHWLMRTYHVQGRDLYSCIQANAAYKQIEAPKSLDHRYITEDIPCGLVPLEAIGKALGLRMVHTSLIIDLAERLLQRDFRREGRRFTQLGELYALKPLALQRTVA